MKRVCFPLFVIILVFVSTELSGEETKLVVRVKAKDAKFIGTSMGGAQVVVRDGETGEILASGLTSGGTGNTKILMMEPHKRGVLLSDESAAKFETSININEPTLVTIEAQAPMAQKQSSIKSSTQVWLIPGKPIAGDGVIIEVGGFAVDVLMPQTHESIKLNGSSVLVPIKANMVMM